MADSIFTRMEARFLLPRHRLPNPFIPIPTLGFFYIANQRLRPRRNDQRLILVSKNNNEPVFPIHSSSEFDIIHTHEHSDGSLVFKFGDPSELVKDDQPKTEQLEIERQEISGVVKVLDGGEEKEVIVRKIEREQGDGFRSDISVVVPTSEIDEKERKLEREEGEGFSSDVSVVPTSDINEESVEESENIMQTSQKDEKEVIVRKLEREEGNGFSSGISLGVPTSEVDVESVEESENVVQTSEKNKKGVLLRKLEREEGDGFSSDMSAVIPTTEIDGESLEDSKDVMQTSEKDEDFVEESEHNHLPLSTLTIEEEEASSSVLGVKNIKDDKESLYTVPLTEIGSGLDNSGTSGGFHDESGGNETVETAPRELDNTEIEKDSSLEIQSVAGDVNENGANESLQQSTSGEPAITIEVTGKIIQMENFRENVELMDLLEGPEDQSVERRNLEVISEDSSHSNVIQDIPNFPSRETELVLDKEADSDTIEEAGKEDILVTFPMIENHLSSRILEAERSTADVQNLSEASDHELVELKDNGACDDSSKITMSGFVLSSGAALLAHPSKVLTGGEDSFFISGSKWLGIADGVSQWSLEGMSPGVYAEELTENCKKITLCNDGLIITKPGELISLGMAESQSPGSSTILVALFDGQVLSIANIGDSGFLILRNGVVYKKSFPMYHEFGFPVQIERGADPSQLLQEYAIEVNEDDTVIIATDGLFDNLYEQEIVATVSTSLEAGKRPKEIAELLAARAQYVGSSAFARSPFADAAHAAGYMGYAGGKLDDVAVIVSLVRKA